MKTIIENTSKGLKGVRSSLNEWNNGICGSANNCNYTGKSIVWGIVFEDEYPIAEFKTKKEMLTVFNWIVASESDCMTCDIETAYINANNKRGIKL